MVKKIQINTGCVFVILCIIFPLTTFTQTLSPFSLNRILAVGIVLLLIYMAFLKSPTYSGIISYIYLIVIYFYTSLIAQDFLKNIEDVIYFSTTVLLVIALHKKQNLDDISNSFIDLKRFTKIVIWVSELLLLKALFSSNCYDIAWGGDVYFTAWSSTQHSLASACCTLIVIVILYYKEKFFSLIQILFIAIPAFCILQSGARVFLLTLVILLVVYINSKTKKNSGRIISLIVVIGVVIYAFLNSNMLNKVMYLLNNPYNADILNSFTGGRTDFWKIDLLYFSESNILYKIFGQGFDCIYRVNESLFGIKIWAHNDIINLLVSIGIFGTLFYILCWIKLFKKSKIDFSKVNQGLFILYIIIPMIINGLYNYVHFIVGIPFLIIFLRSRNNSMYPGTGNNDYRNN